MPLDTTNQGIMAQAMANSVAESDPPKPVTAKTPDAGPPPSDAPASISNGQVPPGYFQQVQQSLQAATAALQQTADEPMPDPPPDQFMPPPPAQQPYNPIHAWGSTAMFLAGIGSLLTRTPLTTALNAAGGVLNAYKQQNAQAAAESFGVWKAQTANALNMQKYEFAKYKDAITSHSNDLKAQTAAVLALATAFRDETTKTVLEAQGIPGVQHVVHKRGKAASDLAGKSQDLEELALEQADWADWQKHHRGASPAEQLDAYKGIFSKSIKKATEGMTPDQRIDFGLKLYNQRYNPNGTGADSSAPSFEDYMKDGQFDSDLASIGGGGDGSGDDGATPTDNGPPPGAIPIPPSQMKDAKGKPIPDGTAGTINGKPYHKEGDYMVPGPPPPPPAS
jgi:hypothetical protein